MNKILLGVLFAFLFISCKKTVDELPPVTQTGADTFGAKVNGNYFVPQGFGPFPANNLLQARIMPNNDIFINARNFASSPNEKEFELYIKNAATPGVYPLNGTGSYGYYVKRTLTPENEWKTNATYTGTINLTVIDRVNKFVSGTFEFDAININNDPEPLTVTEGRFDIILDY
jgi:hypothetical protein